MEQTENMRYENAKKRVGDLRDFYTHAFVSVLVNIFLVILNFIVSPNNLWFYWTTLGWAIGLIAHAYSTFGTNALFGSSWEEKKINEIMDKDRK